MVNRNGGYTPIAMSEAMMRAINSNNFKTNSLKKFYQLFPGNRNLFGQDFNY